MSGLCRLVRLELSVLYDIYNTRSSAYMEQWLNSCNDLLVCNYSTIKFKKEMPIFHATFQEESPTNL